MLALNPILYHKGKPSGFGTFSKKCAPSPPSMSTRNLHNCTLAIKNISSPSIIILKKVHQFCDLDFALIVSLVNMMKIRMTDDESPAQQSSTLLGCVYKKYQSYLSLEAKINNITLITVIFKIHPSGSLPWTSYPQRYVQNAKHS